jgi:N-acetylneuraminic acid mutarotase
MKTIFLLFLHLSFIQVNGQVWESVSSVPSAGRDDGVAFAIGGLGYLVTGNQNGFTESNKLFKYDPKLDVWKESTPFPGEPRQYAGSFVMDDKAYVLCGLSEAGEVLNDVWQFNSITSEWKRMKDFPGNGRWSFFSFSTLEFGFIGTGSTIDFGNVDDCWKYIPYKDEWVRIQDYPEGGIRDVVGFCLGNECFAGTGFKYNPLTFSKRFYKYDLTLNLWSSIQDFPGEGRGYAGVENVGDKAIVGGGWGDQNTYFKDNYTFSVENGWEEIEHFPVQGWRGMSSFSIDNSVYFLTGLYENLSRTSDVHKITFSKSETARLYPNPTNDISHIYNSFGAEIHILDLKGNVILKMPPNDEGYHILPKLSSGIYLVKVIKDKVEFIFKWIII